jgi:hypothetical protein
MLKRWWRAEEKEWVSWIEGKERKKKAVAMSKGKGRK